MKKNVLYQESTVIRHKAPEEFFKIRNKIVFSVFISLIVIQIFNLGLLFFTLGDTYKSLVTSRQKVLIEELRVKIFSKSSFTPENFLNLDNEINEKITRIIGSNPTSLEILDSNYNSIYTSSQSGSASYSPELISNFIIEQRKNNSVNYFSSNKNLISFFPISNNENERTGYVVFSTSEEQTSLQIKNKIISTAQVGLITLLVVMMIIFYIVHRSYITQRAKKLNKIKLLFLIFFISIIPQVGFLIFNSIIITGEYKTISQKKHQAIESLLRSQPTNLIDDKEKFTEQLNSYFEYFPEIEAIEIYDKNEEEWIFVGSENENTNFLYNLLKSKNIKAPLGSMGDDEKYFFTISSNQSFVFSKIQEAVLSSVTVLVISGLLLFELFLFLFSRKIDLVSFSKREDDSSKNVSVRALAFITIFSIDMLISFLPLYIDNIYTDPVFGIIGKEFLRPLPIVFELLFVTIAILLSKNFFDNKGWQYPLFIGLFFIGLGNFFSYLSDNVLLFILSRGISGFGYGLSIVSFNSYIVTHTSKVKRSQGFAHLGAALASGTIAGSLVGGILADQFGRQIVFLLTLIPVVVLFFWIIIIMRQDFHYIDALKRRKKFVKNEVIKFLMSPSIWPNLFLLTFPYAILFVGFYQYSVPVYLGEQGYSNADVARALTLYGFLSIILLPLAGKWVDKLRFSYPILGLFAFITASSLFIFSVLDGYVAVILSLSIFAVGAALSEVSRPVHLLEQDISHKIGQTSALSVFNTVERAGQFMGPLIFRISAIFVGIQYSFVLVGSIVGFMYLIFFLKTKPSYYTRLAKKRV